MYVVISTQFLKAVVPGGTVRLLTVDPKVALSCARRLILDRDTENVLICNLKPEQEYVPADFSEGSLSGVIVYVGWEVSGKITEKFYGEFKEFEDPSCKNQLDLFEVSS